MRLPFCAEDPGGANAILPVYRALSSKAEVTFLGAKNAVDSCRAAGIPIEDGSAWSDEELAARIRSYAPDAVVAGTSSGSRSIDKRVLPYLSGRCPAVAVIDFWSNYGLRFSDDAPALNLRYLPDRVCVIDEDMKQGCVQAGVPEDRLVVTGSPYLTEALRRIMPGCEQGKRLLFISQPLSAPAYQRFPFDEYSVLRELLSFPAIGQYDEIVIKLHPKERKDTFTDLLREFPDLAARVSVRDGDLYTLINEARLIVGMNSMVLLEASLAGKIVISYQPGIAPSQDILRSNRTGASYGCYTREDFYAMLKRIQDTARPTTPDAIAALRRAYVGVSAIVNIIKVIYTYTTQQP